MRFLIADGAEAVRSALRLLLENRLGQPEILEAQNVKDIQLLIQDNTIDIALIDWHLRFGGGTSAIRVLRQHRPDVHIVVLSGRPEIQGEALEAQADAFVSKGDPPEALLSALDAVTCAGIDQGDFEAWRRSACLAFQPAF